MEAILHKDNLNRAYKRVKANKGVPGIDGIPTVTDRTLQQAITQKLVPIYEPLFADDIVLLAKSKRASERLLESSTKYLEGKLKLTVNREKKPYSLSVGAHQLLKPPCTERYARWCERTGANHSLLLDFQELRRIL